MYCVNCGVKLEDTEKDCPLCGTRAYHPDMERQETAPLYPQRQYPDPQIPSKTAPIIWTTLFLLPMFITLLCDMQINHTITWSGYVVGALIVGYAVLVFPFWFRKPNAALLVPFSFFVIALYVMYINHSVEGNWYLSFAFPVIFFLGALITSVVVLLRYFWNRRLYVVGGSGIALGIFMPVMEYLICITFQGTKFIGWSFYPLTVFLLLGGMLAFLAVFRPAREMMNRKFFI